MGWFLLVFLGYNKDKRVLLQKMFCFTLNIKKMLYSNITNIKGRGMGKSWRQKIANSTTTKPLFSNLLYPTLS